MSPLTQRALTDDDARGYIALVDAVCDADDNDERWDEEEYLFHLHDPLNVPGIDATQGFFDGDRPVAAGLLRRRSEATPCTGCFRTGLRTRTIAVRAWAPDCCTGWKKLCRVSTNTASPAGRSSWPSAPSTLMRARMSCSRMRATSRCGGSFR